MAKTTKTTQKRIETITHDADSRKNIPTAEYESVMEADERTPITVAYERRDPDLDPQLVWRGKDIKDWSDLVVPAPPLFIQEKVHPKVLIDDLVRHSKVADGDDFEQIDLFADFNGVPDEASRTEFYEHDANWTNRMILGDSLQVMASMAEREGLRGQVQCIYLDPPYGIKFNSNFQWSTTSRTVSDGRSDHITREPEQVRAFRDTWRDGIHSYLTYLRDRLTVARDLLTPSGSVFVQIGDENVHRVRVLMDEIFGADAVVGVIAFKKTAGAGSISGGTNTIPEVFDYVLWYGRTPGAAKYRQLFRDKVLGGQGASQYQWVEEDHFERRRMSPEDRARVGEQGLRVFGADNLTSASGVDKTRFDVEFEGRTHRPHPSVWKTSQEGMARLLKARRLIRPASNLSYVRYIDDFPAAPLSNFWDDTASSFMADKVYVVQTNLKVVERCILMATDPGDLVLDPTCGSGTTATVAEQWGRRWITVDTSRVALALARARIMGARYPFYLLADSEAGRSASSTTRHPARADLRQGFVYRRVPHIMLKSIANNTAIDVIWDKWEAVLAPLLESLNEETENSWEEWQVPRADDAWTPRARVLHTEWSEARVKRQLEIDGAIAERADSELLYDQPTEDRKVVRVAGPFTVESLSPHRIVGFDENDKLVDPMASTSDGLGGAESATVDFGSMVLENLKTAGVQQAHKEDKLDFVSVNPWPGKMVCGEGLYREGSSESAPEKRAALFVGPEFGTVSRADLVEAAKEAGDAGFDVLVACAFNYEAHASEFDKLGRIPVLKARMNADLHMADDLKNTGKGNLFVIFGEPDIELLDAEDDQLRVRVNGVDVFDPSTGEVRSDGADGIACWFVDTDYNEESFFVRHAYFLGANDPYKALKTTLKAEIDQDAWESLYSDTSRPFDKPASGRIAVKVINHLGDEVMKVLRVD